MKIRIFPSESSYEEEDKNRNKKATDWQKILAILANDLPNKELASRIGKVLSNPNKNHQTTTNPRTIQLKNEEKTRTNSTPKRVYRCLKHIQRCPTPLATREVRIKTAAGDQRTVIRRLKLKNTTPSTGEDVEKLDSTSVAGQNAKYYSPRGRQSGSFL